MWCFAVAFEAEAFVSRSFLSGGGVYTLANGDASDPAGIQSRAISNDWTALTALKELSPTAPSKQPTVQILNN